VRRREQDTSRRTGQVRIEFPAWRIAATDEGFTAVRGDQQIEAGSLAALEAELHRREPS
jgi:hypothetical protein